MTTAYRDGFLTAAPLVALMAITLFLGIAVPEPLAALLREAAALVGGQA